MDAKKAKETKMTDMSRAAAVSSNSCIQRAVVVIHGAGRNADDYFCTMLSVVEQASGSDDTQHWGPNSTTLVLAPLFAGLDRDKQTIADLEDDGVERLLLHWETADVLGGDNPWRYGADAVVWDPNSNQKEPTYHPTNISSFEVIDQLMTWLLSRENFPILEHVTVVGHSAGGQFVQRWALLTPHDENTRIRAVVANPSSYAYLIPERYLESKHEWVIPDDGNDSHKCSLFDRWEWGLRTDDDDDDAEQVSVTPSYVRNIFQTFINRTSLIRRFGHRDVVYLVGSRDKCNISMYDENSWCYSHGLETTCMDQLQGSNRLARHLHYVESLFLAGVHGHSHFIVPGVGHDHSLMFHSPLGTHVILDSTKTAIEHITTT